MLYKHVVTFVCMVTKMIFVWWLYYYCMKFSGVYTVVEKSKADYLPVRRVSYHMVVLQWQSIFVISNKLFWGTQGIALLHRNLVQGINKKWTSEKRVCCNSDLFYDVQLCALINTQIMREKIEKHWGLVIPVLSWHLLHDSEVINLHVLYYFHIERQEKDTGSYMYMYDRLMTQCTSKKRSPKGRS